MKAGTIVEITVKVEITNPKELLRFVRDQYKSCWFDESWRPKDAGEAVLEALVLSNCNPSPDEYGIQICDYKSKILKKGGE
jgi:hypothetical protein